MDAAFVDNATYENEAPSPASVEEAGSEKAATENKPRELFAFWNVCGENHKLRLTPSNIMELERMYKRNLLNLMGDMDHLPSLTTMLQITHAAMKTWQHGLKLATVENLFEKYLEEGGSQLQFYVEVFMKIYTVSGFFSTTMSTELSEDMDEAAKRM